MKNLNQQKLKWTQTVVPRSHAHSTSCYCIVDSCEVLEDEDMQQGTDNEDDVAMDTEETNGAQSPPTEYNPLIVRRSNRAIKPTKDVDLYLLGAQYGIDLEGSEVDSSDPEFSPERKGTPHPDQDLLYIHTSSTQLAL